MEPSSNKRHSIRPARSSDLDRLREIELECFGESGVPLAQLKWLLEGQGENPAFEVRVAYESGEGGKETLLGFLCWKVRKDDGKLAYELLDLSVGKFYREERVEHELVQTAIDEASSAGALGVSVNVAQSNLAAATFYLKQGFQLVQSVPKYYADGGAMDLLIRRLK